MNFLIKEGTKSLIHLPGAIAGGVTLCGLPCEGDGDLGLGTASETSKPATCEQCIAIVEYCKAISALSYISSRRRAVNPQQYQ